MVYNLSYRAGARVKSVVEPIALDTAKLVAAHPELLAQLPPKTREALADLDALDTAARAAAAMSAALTAGTGVTIITRARDYIVTQVGAAGDEVILVPPEQLAPVLRQGVGMLKLVAAGDLIPDVGVRIDETTYFVLLQGEAT